MRRTSFHFIYRHDIYHAHNLQHRKYVLVVVVVTGSKRVICAQKWAANFDRNMIFKCCPLQCKYRTLITAAPMLMPLFINSPIVFV